MTDLFKTIKSSVTARQAGERYGLVFGRNGLARCPFHTERTPSMKVDRRYYCFGCHATGDAVDLTGQLLGLRPKQAAERIALDFGLGDTQSKLVIEPDGKQKLHMVRKRIREYIKLLESIRDAYAPRDMDAEWDECFIDALKRISYAELLLEITYEFTPDMADSLMAEYESELNNIELFMEQFTRKHT